MLDLGVHVADLAIWIMGQAIQCPRQVARLAKQIDVDDTGALILHSNQARSASSKRLEQY